MWLVRTSSRSSPASVVSSLQSVPSSPGLELWVTSSGTPSPRASSWLGWRRRPWSVRLFGSAASRTWTASSFAARLTSSPPDSPAPTSVRPDAERASRVRHPVSGGMSPASPRRPEPRGSSSKTSQPFALLEDGIWVTTQRHLFEHSAPYSQIWPRSGSMRSGSVYERPTWVPPTSETGGSVWPTATSTDEASSSSEACSTESGRHTGTTLTHAVRQWPTAGANDFKGSNQEGQRRRQLDEAAEQLWPTPRTITGGPESAERKQELGRTESGGGDLQAAVALWPTPAATVINDGESPETFDERRRGMLAKGYNGNGGGLVLTVEAVRFHRAQETATPGPESSPTPRGSRRRLNPAFVEWLMGYPDSWTHPDPIDSAVWGMPSYLSRLRRRLQNYFGGCAMSDLRDINSMNQELMDAAIDNMVRAHLRRDGEVKP